MHFENISICYPQYTQSIHLMILCSILMTTELLKFNDKILINT